jgi:DNA-binding NarL/FixJ family response regulator
MIRVLLADDQDLVRAGLRSLLTAYADLDVVGEAAEGAEAVAMALRLRPDVVVMDLRMPGRDGIEATDELRRVAPGVRVLVLTTFDDDELVHAALRAGASGFLLKDAPVEQLAYGIRCVHSGEALVSPSVTRRLLDRLVPPASRPMPPLTERERAVLIQLARGLSNRELAAEFHLSEATVKTHVSSLLTKLDLRDRLQAVVLAYESGLVRPGEASR